MKLASLALFLSVSLSSCFSLNFEPPALESRESRTMMRVDEASGALEWLSIDRGVRVRDSNGVAHLRAVLAGARIYPIEGGGLSSLDFDAPTETKAGALTAIGAARISDLAPDVSVIGVGLAEEPDGSLTLWRHTRLERAAHWLELTQREDGWATPLQLGQFPSFDAVSLELQRAARKAGAVDWRLESRTLVFEVPSTLENALRCQEEILSTAQLTAFGGPIEPAWFSYKDQCFTVRCMVPDVSWFPMSTSFVEEPPGWECVALDELRAAGLPIETPEQLRARFAQLGIVE